VTDRAQALHAFRASRTAGLPAPPTRSVVALPDLGAETDPGTENHAEGNATARQLDEQQPPSNQGEGVSGEGRGSPRGRQQHHAGVGRDDTSAGHASLSFEALVERPVQTCKTMTDIRLSSPSKPLNVDITPSTADAFDERCRALRVKKKDVVEVLLRAWLDASTDSP